MRQIETAKRKRTEELLRRSEEKFRSVVEQSTDGIILADEKGLIVEWNRGAEQITGIGRADALGHAVWEVVSQLACNDGTAAQAPARIRASVRSFHETGAAPWLNRVHEIVIHRRDGTRRILEHAPFPIRHVTGLGIGVIVRDITDRRRSEEERAALQAQLGEARKLEALGKLASEVAHDFNNMLTVILGCTGLIRRRLPEDHEVCLELDTIEHVAEATAEVTRSLLTFARKHPTKRQPVDLCRRRFENAVNQPV